MNTEIIFNIQPGPYWDWRVAMDLFLGGAGAGALLFAIYLDEVYKGKHRLVSNTAAWLAPLLIVAGLLLLMSKMGRPFDLFLTYTNFNPTAPLWWGGIFQPLLVAGSLFYVIKWRHAKPEDDDTGRKLLGRLLAPLALIVGSYHGFLLSVMVARPLWSTGPTVVTALLCFASTGIAIVMLVHLIRMKFLGIADEEHVARLLDDIHGVRTILGIVLIVQLGTFFLWWLSLKLGSLQDQQALVVANDSYGSLFWVVGIGLGLVLPLVLGAITIVRRGPKDHRFEMTMIGLSSVLILVGGYFFRLSVLLAGQGVLPFTIDL